MELSYNIEPSGLLNDDLLTEMVRDLEKSIYYLSGKDQIEFSKGNLFIPYFQVVVS
jgi:hypothetical protein